MLLNPFLLSLIATTPVDVQPAPSVQDPAAAAVPAEPKWTGTVSAGLSSSDGNSNNTSAAVDFNAERRGEKDRWTAKGFWNYASQENAAGDSEVTQRRMGASLKYDYFLNPKTFLFGNGGAEYDFKAGIDLRTYIGGGAGYQFYEREDFKLSGEAGLNLFNEDFRGGGSEDYIAARLAETLGWQIKKELKFDHSIELFPSLEDAEDIFGKMNNALKLNLTDKLYAQLQWVMTYDNTPAADERMDNLYMLTIGWSF
jgi:putative salt-induced outer membrane protein YdiY